MPEAKSFCGAKDKIKIARASLHYWEEPCISSKEGSGTIFFSGCPLKCVYCQNREISEGNYGREISSERFEEILFELKEKGANNINLVTADQYVPLIADILSKNKESLGIPIVYNCSGYESPEILSMLEGIVDIYLIDFKYYSEDISSRYSFAKDYFKVASRALDIMLDSVGKPVFSESGLMKKGVIVRHLIIPGCSLDSVKIFEYLASKYNNDDFIVSLMSQYTPNKDERAPKRRITSFEYERVLSVVDAACFSGYFQDSSSAKEEYTPPFDLEGV